MNPKGFFGELRRRNVYKVAVGYAIVGWLLVQIATQVFPFLEILNWVVRLVIALVAIGFPIALVIAWAFEATPEGIKRTEVADAMPVSAVTGRKAEAHTALGQIYIAFAPSDFPTGDRELKHAIELNPNLAVAHYNLGLSFIRQGRLDEASVELRKARELDPLSSVIARAVAIPYYFRRDYTRAFELLRQANELGPPLSATWEIGLYIRSGSLNEAFAEIEKAKDARKSDPLLIYSAGMAYAASGKQAEVLQSIKELQAMSGASLSTAHWIAKIYATLNDKKNAFSWLERGLATGALGVFYKDEPVWDPIRDDPRFKELVGKMVVPETAPTQ